MNYSNALAICGATVAAAAALALTAAPVHGRTVKPVVVTGEQADIVVRRVGYGDLNLVFASDRRVLHERVGSAVTDVCREAVMQPDLWSIHHCSVEAWRGARPQISQAIKRAEQMAYAGKSSIAAVAITITIPEE